MNPELERLEAALRAAHAAGDTQAAQRFAAEIVRLRAEAPAAQSAPAAPRGASADTGTPESQLSVYYSRGGRLYYDEARTREVPLPDGAAPPGAEEIPTQPDPGSYLLRGAPGDEDLVQLRATYDVPETVDFGAARERIAGWLSAGRLNAKEAQEELERLDEQERLAAARERGRASVEPLDGFNAAAAVHGYGSGFFGVGTPLSALGEMISAALPGGDPAMGWGESLEYARGRRDKLREENPREFYAGMGSSIIGGAGAVRGLGAAATRVAPRAAAVFTPQAGQTARNIARIAAAGAAAGGVTALNEEGADAAAGGAALGAVAGVGTAGLLRAGAGAVGAVSSRINPDNAAIRLLAKRLGGRIGPDNAAIRLLAKRLGEPIDAVQQRYNDFVETRGRAPRLVEIVRRETAEELGQISRVRSEAGGIFREAEEQAARQLPVEMAPRVQNALPVANEPAVAAQRAETAESAAALVGRRVRSSVVRQVGRRGVTQDGGQRGRSMDRAMEPIREFLVPVTDEMVEVIQNPDLSSALKPAVRRRVLAAINAAGDETPYLSVGEWDMIRRDLTSRAATPGSTERIYRTMGARVRDYVSGAVPEYDAALREFHRRSATARGTQAGARVLTQQTRDFVDLLESVDPATRVGARVGARTSLAEALSGGPDRAGRFMERLARDAGMRARVRAALRPDEAAELERLAERYGQQLDFSAGIRTGRSVLRQNDTEAFREAVTQAGQVEGAGVRQGARAALTEAAGESPGGAARTAVRLAEDPGLQSRIAYALGDEEQRRLARLGRSVSESSRRLAEAAPPDASIASARMSEDVESIRSVIRGAAVASGRGGGGFVSAFLNEMYQKVKLPKRAARRLAEMAADPARADQVIARLRRAGMSAEAIARMYRDAAIAAGILSGRN